MPHSTSCARGARRRTHSARRAAGSMPLAYTCFMDWYRRARRPGWCASRSSRREMAFEADGQLLRARVFRQHLVCRWRDPASPGSIATKQPAAFREALKRVPATLLRLLASERVSSVIRRTSTARGRATPWTPRSCKPRRWRSKASTVKQPCCAATRSTHAEPGPAGWLLPVDPLLHATDHHA